jgi:hypothetical protein
MNSLVEVLRPYDLRHLAFHLEESNRAADLHDLLQLEIVADEPSRTGSPASDLSEHGRLSRAVRKQVSAINAWHEAKERLGDTEGYLSDIDRSWRLASRDAGLQIERDGRSAHVAQEVRCALLVTSVNSLARSIPPALMVGLCNAGLWTHVQALGHARQLPHPGLRSEALALLAAVFPESQRAELLHLAQAAAREIKARADWRARLLAMTVPQLTAPLQRQVLDEALEASNFKHVGLWSTLSALLPDRPESVNQVIQNLLVEWRSEHGDVTQIAPTESSTRGVGAEGRALEALLRMRPETAAVTAVGLCALHLSEPLKSAALEEATRLARGIDDQPWRPYPLAWLASRLPEPQRSEVCEGMLAAAYHPMLDVGARALRLAAIGPILAEPLRSKVLADALEAASTTQGEGVASMALLRMGAQLPDGLIPAAFELAMAMTGAEFGRAIAALAGRLGEALLRRALAATRRIADDSARMHAAIALLPALPSRERCVTSEKLFAGAGSVEANPGFEHALTSIARDADLDDIGAHLAFVEARQMPLGDDRSSLLFALAPRLPPKDRAEAMGELLMVAAGSGDRFDIEWLLNLAAFITEPAAALPLARQLPTPGQQARGIARLVPHLPMAEMSDALCEALALVESNAHDADQSYELGWALSTMAQHLPDSLLQPAIRAAVSLAHVQALLALSPRVSSRARRKLVAAIRDLDDEFQRVVGLLGMLSQVDGRLRKDLLQEALLAATAILDPSRRADAVELLCSEHPPPDATLLLDLVSSIQDPWQRARAQSYAIRVLPPSAALGLANSIEEAYWRCSGLSSLAPNLYGSAKTDSLEAGLAAARSIVDDDVRRADSLVVLLPHLAEPRKTQILGEALRAVSVVRAVSPRQDALRLLLPHLQALAPASLHVLWRDALRVFASRERKELFSDLRALAPVLSRLGGQEGVNTALDAIQQVRRWWP